MIWIPAGHVPIVTSQPLPSIDDGEETQLPQTTSTMLLITFLHEEWQCRIEKAVQLDINNYIEKLLSSYGHSSIWNGVKEELASAVSELEG